MFILSLSTRRNQTPPSPRYRHHPQKTPYAAPVDCSERNRNTYNRPALPHGLIIFFISREQYLYVFCCSKFNKKAGSSKGTGSINITKILNTTYSSISGLRKFTETKGSQCRSIAFLDRNSLGDKVELSNIILPNTVFWWRSLITRIKRDSSSRYGNVR